MDANAQTVRAAGSRTFCPRERRRFVLISAILASSMGFIDGSVVAIAIPSIRQDLPASLAEALWISNAYMLFLSSLILIGGAAGDSYGLRRTFIAGIAIFVAASLVCALAPNAPLLIGARAIQGVGAAIMVPGSLAIIAKAYPPDKRGKAIGIWASASAFMTIGGPVLGGFVLSVGGEPAWRLIFAINLPLGLAAMAMLWFRVPPDAPEAKREIDWIGGSLVTVSLFLLAYGLTGTEGESTVPGAPRLILFVGAGALFLSLFVYAEMRAKVPMVPLDLFRITAFSGANVLTFFLYFGLSAVLFYLPMTVIGVWGFSESEAAIAFVPFGASIAVLSGWAGAQSDRFGPAAMITAGSVIVALAYFGLAWSASSQDLWFQVLPLMFAGGLGMGLVVSPLSAAVMTSVSDDDTGTASGVNNAISRVAGLVAVASMGLVAATAYDSSVEASGEAAALSGVSFGSLFLGDAGAEAAHQAATNRAFALIATIVGAMSLASAAIAWITLGHGPRGEAARQTEAG
ncbi:MFS transporter [Oricola cellulosilytica]|uniref:MFS transporter n=1 Tax=Oricola cellulosilytica TaxID=1429082 RepID=A0A4V2MNP8_9HYPH|nr:MFS transporter [Oricola cellulosilytica]TCD13896.1 MFS transporter [Oricola cellulosilytica]